MALHAQLSLASVLSLVVGCGDDASREPIVLAALDPTAGELPEGVATYRGTTYVGLIGLGRVDKVDRDGYREPFGTLPAGPPGMTFVVGLTTDPRGDVFAIYGSFAQPELSGVYRIPASGGAATRFGGSPELVFPNDLDFAPDGSLFVTNSGGSIFKLDARGGLATKWSSDPLLAPGGSLPCGPHDGQIPLGANGITHDGSSIVVTNTEHASLVRIPILPDGSAGAATVIAGPDCERFYGIDGVTTDRDGSWLVADQRTHSVVRVQANGDSEVVASGGALDGPASLDIDDTGGRRRLLVTSSAFNSVEDPAATPRPGLVEIELD